MKRSLAPLLTFLALSAFAADPPPPAALAAARAIRPEGLEAHMRFLSDDLLEGRGAGTRGFDIASRYVATRFAAIGLEPLGDRGTYFQRVPFRSIALVESESSFTVTHGGSVKTLELKKDYLSRGSYFEDHTEVTAPLVFVGYGVTAAELGYDDYAGVDARGKIVVYLSGAPAKFSHTERAYYSSGVAKDANAEAHGAIGMLNVSTPPDEIRAPFAKKVLQFSIPVMRWLNKEGKPGETSDRLRVSASMSRSGAEVLFEGAPSTLDAVFAKAAKSEPQGFALPASVTIRQATRQEAVTSANVTAVLRGSDPELRHEYVVYSAHLDHLGIGGAVNGDDINNGAYDNASGIACILEIARAYAAAAQKPRRSVIFLAVTGEEKGTQGSQYFVYDPPVPLRSLVADINIDMFLMLYPVGDVVPIGSEHSSLAAPVAKAAGAFGFTVSPDPAPDEVRFVRSDQYSFVRKGVPAVILKHGGKSKDPAIDGAKVSSNWLRTIYHSPKDDMNQHFDWDSGVRYARTNFVLGWLVANADNRPAWNKGDFFGEKFGK
jgi:hypothetical protein